jgi:hypothetical protein
MAAEPCLITAIARAAVPSLSRGAISSITETAIAGVETSTRIASSTSQLTSPVSST